MGGNIADLVGWRSVFLIQLPPLVISSILVFIYVDIQIPNPPLTIWQKLKRIDLLGSLTFLAFVSSLLAVLNYKGAEGLMWRDIRVWGCSLTAAVTFIAFILVEGKISPQPVMVLKFLSRRTLLLVFLISLSVFVPGMLYIYADLRF